MSENNTLNTLNNIQTTLDIQNSSNDNQQTLTNLLHNLPNKLSLANLRNFQPVALTKEDIDPITHPVLAINSFFLSILLQRHHMRRYLLLKSRTLALISFSVNYACFYYTLFNIYNFTKA
jgi:hypothetical protein